MAQRKEDLEARARTEAERALLDSVLSCATIGSPATVQQGLKDFIERTGADELMIASQMFDPAARLRSYEIASQVREGLSQPA